MHHQNPTYAAMVQELDDGVGRVLKHLDERKLADHTIVIFTSDNGGYINKEKPGGANVTNNFPLRSGKGSLYEGGVRVPLIVRWPGVTPANAVCDEPVICMDFFPTLTQAAGAKSDTGIDGLGLSPLFKDPSSHLNRDALYFHYPHYYATTTPVSAVRAGEWKLLEYFEDRRLELYNLKDDPSETVNLAQKEPAVAQKLHDKLDAWRKEVGAQLPTSQKQASAADLRTIDPVFGKNWIDDGD
jgi:arylsulfatase A-like enzyme